MTQPTAQEMLKYAYLQLASEAAGLDPAFTPAQLATALLTGNNRSSRFTQAEAAAFTKGWTVVAQTETKTGFSGTLFKDSEGNLVMSFRSTEFIDDAVRDNQQTNKTEIAGDGWAFGQIADMEAWYQQLKSPGGPLSAGQHFSVTGYSLGGHLATAFDILRHEDQTSDRISEVVTFNGAGVGLLNPGAQLHDALAEFNGAKTDGANTGFFHTAVAATLYEAMKQKVNGTETSADVTAFLTTIETDMRGNAPDDPQFLQKGKELALLDDAAHRVLANLSEINRVAGLTSGGVGDIPKRVTEAEIDATHLDYQIAVLRAGESTQAYHTEVLGAGGQDTLNGFRPEGPAYENFYDVLGTVYGAQDFSAVGNSQLHYGALQNVAIEDQPLYRGLAVLFGGVDSLLHLSAKLLVPQFEKNDFGDTHSLMLIIDGLSARAALERLDPDLSGEGFAAIFTQASNASAQSIGGSQGIAEGDVLENIANSLGLMLGLHTDSLLGNPVGGTWAQKVDPNKKFSGRDSYQDRIVAINKAIEDSKLAGKISILATDQRTASLAVRDFGAVLALQDLSAFRLHAKVPSDQAAVDDFWSTQHAADFKAWKDQAAASVAGDFSTAWANDRGLLLQAILAQNEHNTPGTDVDAPIGPLDRSTVFQYYDPGTFKEQGLEITHSASNSTLQQWVIFGSEGSEKTLKGTEQTRPGFGDRIYGGGGDDVIDGLAGDDYIEGNIGNDDLTGGTGNDTLVGGSGNDKYRFDAGSGFDVIQDSDGLGSVVYGARAIDGADASLVQGSENVWRSNDDEVFYTLVAATDTQKDLYITFADHPDVIKVDAWKADSVGIHLAEAVTPTTPPGSTIISGDFAKIVSGQNYVLAPTGYQVGAAQPDTPDVLWGTRGNDVIEGKGGNDGLFGGDGDDLLDGGTGDDLLLGGVGADVIDGGDGNDFIFGSATSDALSGFDAIRRPTTTNFLQAGPPLGELVAAQGFSWTLVRSSAPRTKGTIRYVAVSPSDAIIDPTISDVNGNTFVERTGNVIDGGAGDDYIAAGTGADIVSGGDGDDDIFGMDGDDVLAGGLGADLIFGDGPLTNEQGVFTPIQFHGNDILTGGGGDDVLIGQGGNDVLDGGDGDDWLYTDYSDVPDVADPRYGIDRADGGAGNDLIVGGGKGDKLYGGTGDDEMWGDGNDFGRVAVSDQGNDEIYGEAGNDQLIGGGGMDSLYGGDGNDQLLGDDHYSQTGDGHAGDLLDGGAGDDTIFGGGGNDTASGGDGNDKIHGDDRGDVLAPSAHGVDTLYGNDGNDTIVGGGNGDFLFGGDGDDNLRGDGDAALDRLPTAFDGNDYLSGDAGNDVLTGDAGNDTLVGGTGNDTLQDDSGDDRYVYARGDGQDLIEDGAGVDTLQLVGIDKGDISLVAQGSDLFVVIDGNVQQELQVKDAFSGNPATAGANGAGGIMGAGALERIEFADGTVWTVADIIAQTSSGTPTTFTATTGSDNYVFDDAGDTVTEAAGGGIDTITATVSLALPTNVENLVLAGLLPLNANGNDDANEMVGNDANNSLSGRGGADKLVGGAGDDALFGSDDGRGTDSANDTLIGGLGNDTYFAVTNGDDEDVVIENPDEGIDTVISTFSYALPDNVENLTISSFFFTGDYTLTGNSLDNVLRGSANSSASNFDGGAGADTMISPNGGGLFHVDNPGDVIISGEGQFANSTATVNVISTVSWVLDPRFKNLTLEGSGDIDGTGNDLANDLEAVSPESGDNVMHGMGGNDTLASGFGRDVLYGDAGNDLLQGGADDDRLFGGDGNDSLFGGVGSDWLDGGAGDDLITLDAGSDLNPGLTTVVFGTGSGHDTVKLTRDPAAGQLRRVLLTPELAVGDVVFTATAGTLTLTLASGDSVAVQGFSQARLRSVDFADGTRLDAAAIASLMAPTSTAPTAGNDVLRATATSHIVSALGGDDLVFGTRGDDDLTGGTGADQLYGGDGNDTYRFNRGDGQDVISDTLGSNRIVLGGTNVSASTLTISATDDDLVLGIAGTSDRVTVKSFFSKDDTSHVALQFANGSAGLTEAQIRATVATINGTAGADTLVGSGQNEHILGAAGDDDLRGAHGNDTLEGGAGNDVYHFGLGDGQDVIDGESADATGLDLVEFDASVFGESSHYDAGRVEFTHRGKDLVIRYGGLGDELTLRNWLDAPSRVEQFVFDLRFGETSQWDAASVQAAVAANNHAPTIASSAPPLTAHANQAFAWSVPAGLFVDGDAGDAAILQYSVTLGDGSALPAWLAFNASNGTLAGIAPTDPGSLHLKLTATDLFGASTSTDLALRVALSAPDLVGGGNLLGTAGDERLEANAYGSTISAGDGNDTLLATVSGAVFNVTFEGGLGDDTITGSYGGDTYVFHRGDGHDTISDDVGTLGSGTAEFFADNPWTPTYQDQLVLDGIETGSVSFAAAGDDLVISVADGSDSVTVKNWFDVTGGPLHKIETVSFDNGQLAASDIDRLVGRDTTGFVKSGSGVVQGWQYDDELHATGWQSSLVGDAGNDLLVADVNGGIFDVRFDGGRGNDTIVGSYAGDVYTFHAGDGQDVIRDDVSAMGPDVAAFFAANPTTASYQDRLDFVGISTNDVAVGRQDTDLLISIGDGSDQVRVEGWFDDTGGRLRKIETLTFDDGVRDAVDIDRLLGADTTGVAQSGSGTVTGSNYDDELHATGWQTDLSGGAGNDTLVADVDGGIFDVSFHGGRGDDSMVGSYAGDTYYFQRGDGQDRIHDDVKALPNPGVWDFFQAHPDEPSYQDKLVFQDINMEDVTRERVANDLVLHVAGATDQVTVEGWYDPNQLAKIETISFANGSWRSSDIA